MMAPHKRIYVAGHKGMVGRALVRRLRQDPKNEVFGRAHDALDLMDQRHVRDFFEQEHIDEVYFAAAKVGGILANSTYPAEFIYDMREKGLWPARRRISCCASFARPTKPAPVCACLSPPKRPLSRGSPACACR